MSQMSSTAPDGGIPARPSSTGRAVMLLAVAVVLGVLLLHELDNGKAATQLANAPAKTATQPVIPATTSTTVALRSPAEVKVLVSNGTGQAGVASKVANRLQPVGYQLAKPNNTNVKETVSSVQFAAGYQQEALGVATALGLPATSVQPLATPAPVADMQGSSVLVIVGSDLANASAATASGTTTQSGSTANPLTSGPLTTATSAVTPTTGAITPTTAPTN